MQYIDAGGKRAVTVWHRRAGKDQTWLNQIIKRMVMAPVCGTYLHIFPKLTQGRRDLWDAKSMNGIPFRAHFPAELVLESSETEMQVVLRPMHHQKAQSIPAGKGRKKVVGSVFQIMGTDKESIENIRGIEAAGAVFSEYSDQDPRAWESILEPVFLANKGAWAAFDFTPKGENHAYRLYQAACQDPSWFADIKTVGDTRRDAAGEDGLPIITEEDLNSLRARGVAEEVIQQEYFCSFRGFLKGTIFGDLVTIARAQRRIGHVTYNPIWPVGTCWDIGTSDHTAVWFYQAPGDGTVRFIDYEEERLKDAPYWAQLLKERKRYVYERMALPWDAKFGAAPYFSSVGFRGVEVAPMISKVQLGIDLTRQVFSTFVFDEAACAKGIEHLEKYRRKWDAENMVFMKDPVHDIHSHGASALITGARVGFGTLRHSGMRTGEIKVETEFDLGGSLGIGGPRW
jgi:hypothetical protein